MGSILQVGGQGRFCVSTPTPVLGRSKSLAPRNKAASCRLWGATGESEQMSDGSRLGFRTGLSKGRGEGEPEATAEL